MAKILIIDDDQSLIGFLCLHLSEKGHTVVSAMDGSSGPLIASREKPDLIILDYNMTATNGAKVHERLRGNTITAGTPVIFLTAMPIGEIITTVKDDGVTRFLQKPVDFAILAKTMAALLPRQASQPCAPPVPPPAEGATVKKILIIEPNPGLNWLMCESLRDAGYVPVACPPEQAVALASELPATAVVAALSSATVDQEPLYNALRGDPRTKDVPLVVITGRGDTTIRRRLGKKPPNVLFKPFELEALVKAVTQALGGM